MAADRRSRTTFDISPTSSSRTSPANSAPSSGDASAILTIASALLNRNASIETAGPKSSDFMSLTEVASNAICRCCFDIRPKTPESPSNVLRRLGAPWAALTLATSCVARESLRESALPSQMTGLTEANSASIAPAVVASLLYRCQHRAAQCRDTP